MGLDPALAGLAMMVSLAFDAVTDPLVGHWSDRLRHRLDRATHAANLATLKRMQTVVP